MTNPSVNTFQKHSADALEDDFDINSVSGSEASDVDLIEEDTLTKKLADEPKLQHKKKVKLDRSLNISTLPPIELSDFFWTRLRSSFENNSELELEGLKLEESQFIDNSNFDLPHVIGNFDKFIQSSILNPHCIKQHSTIKGAPFVLVITPSAIRAASVARALRPACGQIPVAKLFAKHLKIPEQEKFLSKESISLGVGTPNRLHKLAETGFLKLPRLQLIVFDLFQDPKSRTLFDIPECSKDFFGFYRSIIFPLLDNQKIKFAFF